MSIHVREVVWMSGYLRPYPMPSVECPRVKIWGRDEFAPEWMGINHCLPCAYACHINLDMENETGEVHCSAESGGQP